MNGGQVDARGRAHVAAAIRAAAVVLMPVVVTVTTRGSGARAQTRVTTRLVVSYEATVPSSSGKRRGGFAVLPRETNFTCQVSLPQTKREMAMLNRLETSKSLSLSVAAVKKKKFRRAVAARGRWR